MLKENLRKVRMTIIAQHYKSVLLTLNKYLCPALVGNKV
jgi:hypothetical protein